MRTTITLDDDVVRTIREEMKAGSGKTFKEAVNELIRSGRYYQEASAVKRRKPFRVMAKSLGVYEHLNYDKTSELVARLDTEEFIRKDRRKK